jgi:hypothetical protein
MKIQPSFARKTANKYGAKKTMVGEVQFASKKEAQRYMELQLLERAGEITNLRRQVKFELMGQHRPLYTRTGRKMKYTVSARGRPCRCNLPEHFLVDPEERCEREAYQRWVCLDVQQQNGLCQTFPISYSEPDQDCIAETLRQWVDHKGRIQRIKL